MSVILKFSPLPLWIWGKNLLCTCWSCSALWHNSMRGNFRAVVWRTKQCLTQTSANPALAQRTSILMVEVSLFPVRVPRPVRCCHHLLLGFSGKGVWTNHRRAQLKNSSKSKYLAEKAWNLQPLPKGVPRPIQRWRYSNNNKNLRWVMLVCNAVPCCKEHNITSKDYC